MLGTMGLLLFLYGVGIQYGAQFFRGLTSKEGLKAKRRGVARDYVDKPLYLDCTRTTCQHAG